MEGDVQGVRIIPPKVEFKDVDTDTQIYSASITVKNVSKVSKEIRYWAPQDKVFRLKVKNPEKPVAPGLEVSAVIEFEALEAKEYKDRVVVTVDGEVIEVPLIVLPCRPQLSLKGPVDFGNVVANSKVITKEISLYNHGSKEGEFKLRYNGHLPIAIIPSGGKVPAHSVQIIKVEYVTKEPRSFDEKVKVKLEGQEVTTLHVCGNVVEGRLELLSYETEEEIHCVQFGSAYYGTDKTESAILYNNGPEPVSFVAVLDENATGQEVGTDLSKSTAAALINLNRTTSTGQVNPLTSLVTALPNQGILAPYEKIPIFFRFSPRWTPSTKGYTCCLEPPPRNDFALFMYLKVIGASCGFQEDSGDGGASNVQETHQKLAGGSTLEIALTATALPVLLSLSPQTKFDFGECPVGMCTTTSCTLVNESTILPITYQFRRIAHFTVKPDSGKIKPGHSDDVTFLFAPNQVGTFKPTQYVDILGQVADNKNPFVMHLQVIHSLPINFIGSSNPVTVRKAPVFNPGITPMITNEVGLYVNTTFGDVDKTPQAAMLNAAHTSLHRFKSSKEKSNEDETLVAFPNDRAQSVRPSNRNETYKTIFTRTKRHTYIDPDYSYADDEIENVQQHRNRYVSFIDEMRKIRYNIKEAKDFSETNNEKDLAMKPAGGLRPKKLTLKEVGPDPPPPTPPNATYSMLSTKKLAEVELASSKQVRDGLNAVPLTPKEKADCQKILSPQQLHQVIIGPPTIDFGNVCLKSVVQKDLSIISGLDQYIHVVVHVDCRELRQTSPLSQVVPPYSKAVLPLIFESNTKGRFQRSLDYTVNGYYKNHVTVFAEVVPVSLELSTDHLVVEPQIGLPADAGIRGVITLKNKLNYQAEFTWSPILGDRGTAFSIRPATGVVDAFTELDCEVVFHPSYLAPEDGEFALQVHGGNTLKLKCLAKIGATNVSFIDRRISFGQVPLHQTTVRTAMLKNNSLNHAYYQVLDPNPFPGLTVSPIHGVVPVGGVAEIKVHLTPNTVMKFDTRISVSIRGWKTLELRMGGTVEPPCVDIDLPSFDLGGVFCGSQMTLPFTLINKVYTKARIEFNLSKYADFSLEFPGKQTSEDYSFQLMNPGMYSVMIDGGETISCNLIFSPTEVASYDFIMPVTINQTGAPTPSPTPFPPTPAPSNKNSLQHIIQPRPIQVHIATPRRKVIATALRQPLQLSHHKIDFLLSPITHELASSSGIGQSKGTLLVNNSDKPIKWAVDISKGNQTLEEGIFKFLHPSGMPYLSHGDRGIEGELDPGQTVSLGVIFCPDKPGHYEVSLPIILDDDYEKPYQYITLSGELKCPHVWFDPLAIVLTPVPLDMEISADFLIMATDYMSKSHLTVEVPEVECEDGSKLKPLSVNFLEGEDIPPCCSPDGNSQPISLRCQVNFKSSRTVSFSETVVFVDDLGNRFRLPVTATSDNCLMTCYPFLALHRSDHQIVCEQGTSLRGRKTASRESMNAGEAVLMPCESPHRPSSRPSTTATSSNFEVSSSSFEDSTQSLSDSTFPSTPRDGAVNKFTADSEQTSHGRNGLQSRSLGSALFPEEDTEEGIFHTEVLLAVQRWFSSQGWPNGPNPIVIPDSLRSGISKKPSEMKVKNSKGDSFESSSLKKELRTVYDMIAHLCGRHVPGIPINNPLPSDPMERAKQIYWQHSTLLTFLKAQGACVASIKPEYLMEPQDYKHWAQLQKEIEIKRNQSGHREIRMKTEEEEALEEQLFEAVSKRAWTDILLQLLKTLHLAKITPRQFKNLPTPYKGSNMPMVDPDPLCSNVYSLSERIILLWLNHNYEQQREKIWANCTKGGVPPSRWVVNFDFDLLDGLVLAAALGAHAPFLIRAYLQDMYTHPSTAEQCLHNALKVVNAMRFIGIDYDIQAIDITDPNPISLLLLCVHFYNNLPQYLPKSTVEFVGSLHMTVLRQVKLSNPSSKPLVYHAIMAGPDADQFELPKGPTITIQPKSSQNVSVEFTSRFLRPAEAVLVLVGRRQGSNVGSTIVFSLKTQIDNIIPKTIVKVESPCYELNKVLVEVTNPFSEGGDFKIILIESKADLANGDGSQHSLLGPKKKKVKKVHSKINTGITQSEPEDKKQETVPDVVESVANKKQGDCSLCAFHSPATHVHLEAGGLATVTIHFLPFQMGKMQCSVILQHDQIGDIVYSIEATATLPLPMALPFRPTSGSSRISMMAATGTKSSIALKGGEDHTIYWKCETNQEIKEILHMPLANVAKDKALIIVAQQKMSGKELERRKLTGTLASGAITAKAVDQITKTQPSLDLKKTIQSPVITFEVELDSKHFTSPNKITVTNPNYRSGPCEKANQSGAGLLPASPTADLPASDGIVELPVTFSAKEPGVYPCHVTVKSTDDIRSYYIECMVTPEGSEAVIEFSSPVHETVTQQIPIINQTNHDWPMIAKIEGSGFTGPSSITAKAYTTTKYPLSFKPQFEGPVKGKLILANTEDHIDHTFHLRGNGDKPLPIDHIKITAEAKKSQVHMVRVPNVTRKKLFFRIETDLPYLSGPECVIVLPGQTGSYELKVTPLKRGHHKGVITFIAGPNPIPSKKNITIEEVDSDGDEVVDETERRLDGYRIWYAADMVITPPPPEKTLEISCPCQKQAILEIGVNNPTNHELTLEAEVNGSGLSGPSEIKLKPKARGLYEVVYAPAVVGKYNGSVQFFHRAVGEFWYDLVLVAEKPLPTTLPHLECELGRWARQYITLNNPTDQLLLLIPTVSNTNNFRLERDNEQPFELQPISTLHLPLTFMPSTLGPGDHKARISFHCEQLGEWVFFASGTGILPQAQDPVSLTAPAGSSNTLIIPFRNPLDIPVLVDVELRDKFLDTKKALDLPGPAESPFTLLLKERSGIHLSPKSILDIPISFAPEEMRMSEAECIVTVHQEDGTKWFVTPSMELKAPERSFAGWESSEIKWVYPVRGYPEHTENKDVPPAVISCRARERTEERLEVTLSGVAPSSGGPKRGIRTRAVTPQNEPPRIPEGVVVAEGLTPADEFTYEIIYSNENAKKNLEHAVALKLLRQQRDRTSGLVTLVFCIVYAPYQSMHCDVQLLVQGATGGLWRFPLRFVASEPEPDDVITVEAIGLDRVASVGFRLTSQTSHPVPYYAYFLAGSDPELSITPSTGELLPVGSKGTLLKINFRPTKYGKIHQGKLVVQCPDMQWTYIVKGVPPDYTPPRGYSSHPIAGPHPDPRQRTEKISFIKQNLKLTTTAVSSPIKGAPLINKHKTYNRLSLN